MRTTSNLISELARAIGLTDPEGDMTDLAIPPLIMPALALPLPLDTALPGTTTDIQRGSWGVNFSIQQAASTGVTQTTIATMGRGLWDISVQMCMRGNFNQGLAESDGLIRLFYANGTTMGIVALQVNAPGNNISSTNKVRVLIPNETTILELRRAATGVGESFQLSACIYCAKLL